MLKTSFFSILDFTRIISNLWKDNSNFVVKQNFNSNDGSDGFR